MLTNKRLYYNHKTGILNIRAQEEKVNVKDITGSKITDFNPLGILILSILLLVLGIIFILDDTDYWFFLPVALVLALVYYFAKKSYLKIEYAGGSIFFSVKKYGKENIQRFQKCIYAVKDHIDANEDNDK